MYIKFDRHARELSEVYADINMRKYSIEHCRK